MAEKTENKERIYTIPLRREYSKVSRIKKTNRSIDAIRNFVKRYMKTENVNISQRVNEKIWERGIKKPPSKIKVKVKINDKGFAVVRTPEEFDMSKEMKKQTKKLTEKLKESIKREDKVKKEPKRIESSEKK